MSHAEDTQIIGKAEVAILQDLRIRLLHLHKTLLEMERLNFERKSGSVTPGELLQLVINDPQFAWLRTISALVVEIDEVLTEEEPALAADLEELMSQARLLFSSPGNEDFKIRYQDALQREPAAVMAHAAVMQLLRKRG